MEEFKKGYGSLNPAQRQAVDQIDGAVLVIAGPGTGKTQLLSLRVANILQKTDTPPEGILCLTFTNYASSNMQLRLSSLIGPPGQHVMVKTFHSFAAEIMNLYPDYFWNGAQLTNVPDAVQLEIITDILSGLPLDNPLALKFAGQFTSTKGVIGALKLTKEAGLTPDKLRALINLNLSYINEVEEQLIDICAERLNHKTLDELAMRLDELPKQNTDELTRPLRALSTIIADSFETAHSADEGTGRTKNTSAWKARWIQSHQGEKGMHEERGRNEWWLKLAEVYAAYRDVLHTRGFYDYSDMIIEVISQLEQNADMRSDIQERFQYVLIDEFQDTNAAQLRLAHLVADHYAQEGNPNIMAVGDDDQSIYKFNGAELSNMRDFMRSYPKGKQFVLTDNYRSSQAVLDFATRIIDQAGGRIVGFNTEVSKTLIAKNAPETKGLINHLSYPTREHQYYGLSKQIKELRKDPGTVAVLARGHESLRIMAHTLNELKVPVRYEQRQNIFDQPFVVQVVYITEIITAIAEGNETMVNKYLPLLLAHEAWQVEPLSLWQLALTNRSEPHWIDSLLNSGDERLQNIANWLLWLGMESKTQALPRMLEFIVGLRASEYITSPLRVYYLEANEIDTPYLASISAIRKLIDMAQEFCEQGQATVADFVRLAHVSRDNGTNVTDESLFVTSKNSVELLTVYKAKGLEFDSVIVVDAMESIWKPVVKGRKPPANLPLRPAGDEYDDYIRLMYVAVTRARHSVILGSYYTNETGEVAVPSGIIRDILPAKVVTMDQAGDPVAVLESAVKWPRLEGASEKELLKNILENFRLSPSSLLDFLDVAKGGPQYFLEKHLLKLPEALMLPAAFGSAVHASLETAQQLVTDGNFKLSAVLSAYEKALKKQLLSSSDFDRYLTHGQQVISRLFEQYGLELAGTGLPEVNISTYIGSAPIAGKLDRMDFDKTSNELLITDYKTGKPLSSFTTRAQALELKAWRHRTQLQMYTLMAEASGLYKSKPAIKTQMLYVEADSATELTRAYSPEAEELEKLRRIVEIVHQKIVNLNLPDVRHYDKSYKGVQKFEQDLLSGAI